MKATDLLAKYRASINPPYRRRDLITIGATILILLVIPLTIIVALQDRQFSSRAATVAGAGAIRVWKNANSAFDQYTRDNTYAGIINARYQGMLVYEPYFDSRLSWYTETALFYKDAYAIYTDPARNKDGATINWILRDAAGNPCYIPWGSPYDQYAADIGNQAFRDNLINYVVNKLNNFPGYEGVFVDDVNLDDPSQIGISRVSCGQASGSGNNNLPIDPRTGLVMTSDSWNRYFAEFMEQLRNAIPAKQIAHNSIWYITPFDNPYLLREIQAANIIQMEQGFIDGGLTSGTGKYSWSRKMDFVNLVHSNGRIVVDRDEDVTNDAQQEYGVANYFLLNNGNDFYDPVYRSSPNDPWNVYGTNLGSAVNGRYQWNGLWRRDFSAGFVLVNPPGGATTTVNLGGTYSDLYGGQHSSVTLSERSSKIFVSTTIDTTAPSAITDLTAPSSTSNSVALSWTAPGDDSSLGTASSYDIRYSTSVISESNWASASQASGEPTPAVAGTTQTFTVTGLNSSTTYYFAMKTSDEVPNTSALSNVVSKSTTSSTDATPPTTSITSPANGAAVPRNTTITITASASDDTGVTKVEFYVNGSLKCTDTSAAYTCAWKVPRPKDRTYQLQAKAYDAAGNVGTSTIVTVNSR